MDEDIIRDLAGIVICVVMGSAMIGLLTWVLNIVT